MSRAGNFALHLKYIPSTENVADAPSCALSGIDCSLSTVAWARVQSSLSPHTFDLMSLDSNCSRGRDGNFLPHYSPWPTPNSSVATTSTFFPLSSSSDRSCVISWINASASLLLL